MSMKGHKALALWRFVMCVDYFSPETIFLHPKDFEMLLENDFSRNVYYGQK